MTDEQYDKDEQHERVEPLGTPQPVKDETEEKSSGIPIEAPEFVSVAEGSNAEPVSTTTEDSPEES